MRISTISIASAAAIIGASLTVAQAGVLRQYGSPSAAVSIGTYGMHVEASAVIRSLIPKGWKLQLQPSVTLDAKISWQAADTWPDVVKEIADKDAVAVLINWTSKVVSISALQPSGASHKETVVAISADSLHEIHPTVKKEVLPSKESQAHALELLHRAHAKRSAKFRHYQVGIPARASAKIARTAPTAVVSQSAIATNKLSSNSADAPAGSTVTYRIVLPPQPSAGPARSFYAQSAKEVLHVLATHYHLKLEWHGPNFKLPGPVTLLFDGHLREDIALLQTALGPYAPLKVTYYAKSEELVVRHALYPQYLAFASRPLPPAKPKDLWDRFVSLFNGPNKTSQTRAPVLTAAVNHAQTPKPHTATSNVTSAEQSSSAHLLAATENGLRANAARSLATAEPSMTETLSESASNTAAAICPAISLTIHKGTRLSVVLSAFLDTQHMSLKWAVPYDLRAQADGVIKGKSVQAVLKPLLQAVGLQDSIDYQSGIVTVMAAGSTANPVAVD